MNTTDESAQPDDKGVTNGSYDDSEKEIVAPPPYGNFSL